LRFCPVVVSANGRVKPDYVLVADRQERHPEGAYYLEWYDGGRRVRRSVGKDAGTAAARRHQQEQILASKAAGIRLAEEGESNGPLLGDAVATYLDEIRKTKKHKTWSTYKAALSYFLDSCGKARVSEIDRSDLLQFSAFLRDTKKLQPGTVYNKFESVMSFLKANGLRGLVGKNDWPPVDCLGEISGRYSRRIRRSKRRRWDYARRGCRPCRSADRLDYWTIALVLKISGTRCLFRQQLF
jgi:integrase/recombinase XerD